MLYTQCVAVSLLGKISSVGTMADLVEVEAYAGLACSEAVSQRYTWTEDA